MCWPTYSPGALLPAEPHQHAPRPVHQAAHLPASGWPRFQTGHRHRLRLLRRHLHPGPEGGWRVPLLRPARVVAELHRWRHLRVGLASWRMGNDFPLFTPPPPAIAELKSQLRLMNNLVFGTEWMDAFRKILRCDWHWSTSGGDKVCEMASLAQCCVFRSITISQ